MAQLVKKAREVGVPPEDYAKQLVEDGLALQRQAEHMSFEEIMGPVRQATESVDDAEIVKLVQKARSDYYRKSRRAKKG
jgi:hypothetical protein